MGYVMMGKRSNRAVPEWGSESRKVKGERMLFLLSSRKGNGIMREFSVTFLAAK